MKARLSFLALALALTPAAAWAHPPDPGAVDTVVLFNPALLETPESIAIDVAGTSTSASR